jgi:hypothetical protein
MDEDGKWRWCVWLVKGVDGHMEFADEAKFEDNGTVRLYDADGEALSLKCVINKGAWEIARHEWVVEEENKLTWGPWSPPITIKAEDKPTLPSTPEESEFRVFRTED